MCHQILRLITSYKEKIFITASKICSGLSAVYFAYTEAMEAMNYKLFVYRDNPAAIKNLTLEANESQSYLYTFQQEEHLINKLHKGDIGAALNLFKEVCWNNFTQKRISFNMARCLFYDIVSSALKVLNKQVNIDNKAMENIEQLLAELNRSETSREMCKTTEQILVFVGKNIQKNEGELSLYEEIISCVKEHFNDSDFNVSKLADYLSMNMSYLSKYFKDKTGIGLLDYINKIRINYAKDLLASVDMSISEVSYKVGFDNSNSFIRVFKKYEGITPGLYKSQFNTNK